MIRAAIYYLGMVLSLGLYGFTVFPVSVFLPYRMQYRLLTSWGAFMTWWGKVACGLNYRIEGLENLPEGASIIMAKHQSAWETMAFTYLLPIQTWVLKKELLKTPLFGWGLKQLHAIAIDRKAGRKALRQLVDQGRECLERGTSVIVFPEGTRVPPGTRGRYGIGGAMLAAETGYPAVPVAHNAGEFWPRHSIRKRPGTITIRIGKPIDSRGRKAADINREVEAWIEGTMEEITTLRPEPADSVSRDILN